MDIIDTIRSSVIGSTDVVAGPFGSRLVTYAAYSASVQFIVDAVPLIANDGWKSLSCYRFDQHTGGWRHRDAPEGAPLSLDDATYATGENVIPRSPPHGPAVSAQVLSRRGRSDS